MCVVLPPSSVRLLWGVFLFPAVWLEQGVDLFLVDL